MRWPDLTPKQLLAVGIAMYVVFSMAAIQGAVVDFPSVGNETPDAGGTPTAAVPEAAAATDTSAHDNQTAALNCTTVLANGSAAGPLAAFNDSGPRHPLETITAGGNASVPVNPVNTSAITDRAAPGVSSSLERTCALSRRFSPPEWASELAARELADSEGASDGPGDSLDNYTDASPTARAQLQLARNLRATLGDESRSRSEATFDATAQALAARQGMIEDRPNTTLHERLTAERTSLRGARDLVSQTETAGRSTPLTGARRLARTGVATQVAQVSTGSGAHPTTPEAVRLPAPSTPSYDAPSTAVFAILDAYDVDPTDEEAAEIRSLDELPSPTRRELTDLLNAYLGYYRATEATASTDPGGPPNAADVRHVRAAQLQLMAAAGDLQTALEQGESVGVAGPAATGPLGGGVQIPGGVSIDLSMDDSTYEQNYHLQVDVGGDDTYHNNAGGAAAAGKSTDASALIDFGGADTYTGRNGGGWYIVTEESPQTSRAKQGAAAGFLLDVGTASDTYDSQTAGGTIDKRYSSDVTIPPGSRGTNGGGRRAIGFLVDTGGNETYEAGSRGTNGGGQNKGVGFLLDAGPGSDTYEAGTSGTNGGGRRGVGFLFDAGGQDTYEAGGTATNGGGEGIGRAEGHFPGPYFGPKTLVQLLFDVDLRTGGFLVDAGGTDTYTGSNGAAERFGKGFLLDYGSGNDRYDGRNGGARRNGVGVLVDTGGNDTYAAGNRGTNGGGHAAGIGFLLDGGHGRDTYDATTEGRMNAGESGKPGSAGTNGGAIGSTVQSHRSAMGFLLDAGGNDSYIAGSMGANGGSFRGELNKFSRSARGSARTDPTGFLMDMGGDDRYDAKKAGVNGGANSGIGLLYDNAGSDFYTDYRIRCHDCSDIPKGSIGAQIDRAGSDTGDESSSGSSEVLVVDGDGPSAGEGCSDASYQEIQPAVNAAEPGDTVRVCAGTYPGNVTVDTVNVTLRAADTGQVVIDGANTRRYGVALLAGDTAAIGFTATNFTKQKVAFLAVGPQATVAHNTVGDSYFAILTTGLFTEAALEEVPIDRGVRTEMTAIHDNTVTDSTVGILVTHTGNVNVTSNTVRGTNNAIAIKIAQQVTVHDNIVSGERVPPMTPQDGIISLWGSEVTMTENVVTGFRGPTNRSFAKGGGLHLLHAGYGYGIDIRNPLGEGSDATHTLRNNRMADNTYNFLVKSAQRADYKYMDIDTSNTVNGDPVLYLVDATNVTIGPSDDGAPGLSGASATGPTSHPGITDVDDPGYVACIQCVDVTIRNLELAHNGHGVLIAKSRDVTVKNVTVHDTWRGIGLEGSPTNAVLRDNTIFDSTMAISVRHNCGNRKGNRLPGAGSVLKLVEGNSEACPNPSVLIEHNTIRHIGKPTNQAAIRVAGTGVTVRENSISDVEGAGIRFKGRPSYSGNNGVLGTGRKLSADTVVDSTVVDNTITDAFVGIASVGSEGTTFRDNTISDVTYGFFTIWNTDLVFQNNTVTNATQGIYIHWSNVNFHVSNNAFRETRWGLNVQFTWYATPPGAQVTHDFGTSNTVNGDHVLWFREAAHRTIDAEDANMVVCVRCVDVTIRDMTLTDNAHGVILWDATNSRVVNVTATDTFQSGITAIGGQNNVIRNSTVIDSSLPIFVQPIDGRRIEKNQRETVGPIRILNNTVAVEDASWPGPSNFFTRPIVFGHMGITIFNPSVATIRDNRLTDQRWGIVQFAARLEGAEGCPGPRCEPPARAYDLTIANNTITHPHGELGLDRFGTDGPFIFGRTLGIRINVKVSDLPGGTIRIHNNTLTNPVRHYSGITLNAKAVPTMRVTGNEVHGYKQSVQVDARGNNSTIHILRNRLVGAGHASVTISMVTPGETVEVHQNLLHPAESVGIRGYGVFYGGRGTSAMHMGGSGDGRNHAMQPVDATCNRWGPPSGPSSRPMTLVDPVTNEPADGNGSRVSHGHTHGVSNVRFHPWLGESPDLSCTKDLPGTPTPTPPPTPTRTPWPFATPTPGTGGGTGPGTGPGEGPGDGGDGPGPGSTGDRGGEGSITATVDVPVTATPTATPPPTATPEIVPGFGVSVWAVAFVLISGLLFLRRRQ